MTFHIVSQTNGQSTTCIELDDMIPLEWLGKSVQVDGKNIEAKKIFCNSFQLQALGNFVGKEVVLDDSYFDHNAKRFYMP